MKETNVYTKIITDENLMETIPHGSQDYPFRYYYEHLAQFDFNWSCQLTAAFLLIPNSFTVFPLLWMLSSQTFSACPLSLQLQTAIFTRIM